MGNFRQDQKESHTASVPQAGQTSLAMAATLAISGGAASALTPGSPSEYAVDAGAATDEQYGIGDHASAEDSVIAQPEFTPASVLESGGGIPAAAIVHGREIAHRELSTPLSFKKGVSEVLGSWSRDVHELMAA